MARFLTSNKDDIALADAVDQRFRDLCFAWTRIKGESLRYPQELHLDIIRWKSMLKRHQLGDFRHTEAELKSTKTVADWTHQTNCYLRNQEYEAIKWSR